MSHPIDCSCVTKVRTPREITDGLSTLWRAIEKGQLETAVAIFSTVCLNRTNQHQAIVCHKLWEKYRASLGNQSPRSERYVEFFLETQRIFTGLSLQPRSL
jgi:hypothetical protein